MAHKILNIKHFLLFSLMLQLAACGMPEMRTPAPTPQAIHVIYPPSLTRWADKFTACATKEPLVGVYFIESTIPSTQITSDEILLELGRPTEFDLSPSVSQIGLEQIAVVGYLSIRWLLAYLVNRKLYPFAIYCAVVSLLIVLIWLIRS